MRRSSEPLGNIDDTKPTTTTTTTTARRNRQQEPRNNEYNIEQYCEPKE